MPKGQLYINGWDAYTKWGMSMDSNALSALMTPAGNKENLHVNSRAADGQRASKANVRVAHRTISIVFQICAKTEEQFFARYASFCEELAKGFLVVTTSFQPELSYRFEYNQCSQFTQFMRGIAKFTLKLTENDPTERGLAEEEVSPSFNVRSGDGTLNVNTSPGRQVFLTSSQASALQTKGIIINVTPGVTFDGEDVEPESIVAYLVDRTSEEGKVEIPYVGRNQDGTWKMSLSSLRLPSTQNTIKVVIKRENRVTSQFTLTVSI